MRSRARDDGEYIGGRIQRSTSQPEPSTDLYTRVRRRPSVAPERHRVRRARRLLLHRPWYEPRSRSRTCGIRYGKADGSMIHEVVFPANEPNGIGLSPDGRCCTGPRRGRGGSGRDVLAPGELAEASWRHVGVCTARRACSCSIPSPSTREATSASATLGSGGVSVVSPAGRAGRLRAHRRPAHDEHLLRRRRPAHGLHHASRARAGCSRPSGPAPRCETPISESLTTTRRSINSKLESHGRPGDRYVHVSEPTRAQPGELAISTPLRHGRLLDRSPLFAGFDQRVSTPVGDLAVRMTFVTPRLAAPRRPAVWPSHEWWLSGPAGVAGSARCSRTAGSRPWNTRSQAARNADPSKAGAIGA